MRRTSAATVTTRRRLGRRRGASSSCSTTIVTTVTHSAITHVVVINLLTSLVVVKSESKRSRWHILRGHRRRLTISGPEGHYKREEATWDGSGPAKDLTSVLMRRTVCRSSSGGGCLVFLERVFGFLEWCQCPSPGVEGVAAGLPCVTGPGTSTGELGSALDDAFAEAGAAGGSM